MAGPIRIAAVLPSLAGGGAERVTLNLLAGLDRPRFAPTLILLERQGPLESALPADLPVIDLARPRLRSALPALLCSLRALAPDLVFSSLGYVNIALAFCRPLFPGKLILREANLPSLSLPHARQQFLMQIGYRWVYPRADLMLASSERMRGELAALRIPASKLKPLPNPVRQDILRAQAQHVRRTPGPGLRLVAVGRLTLQKGMDRLIALLPVLAGAHLTILGDGPERSRLAALAAQLGVSVDMPGFVVNAPCWIAGADAVVIPSRWEGMPNVALEALTCGVKVVATPEAGGIAELAAAASPGAVTIAPFNDGFAAALAALAPRRDMDLQPSLLPPAYDAVVVARRFAALLAETLD